MGRGQAAVEYLVTYGWAFLVILVAVGALAYFGVINPRSWFPDRCDLGSQLECQDDQILLEDGVATISFFVQNNFGKGITITKANVTTEAGDTVGKLGGSSASSGVQIPAGDVREFTIEVDDADRYFRQGDKSKVIVTLEFRRTGSVGTSTAHTLTGILYARAK